MKRAHAFTLIEVLIALAILAIALAAAMRAAGTATVSAEQVKLNTYATWVAENRIAELTARRAFPSAGSSNGQSDMAGITFQWTQVVSTTANSAFRKIEVAVTRPDGDYKFATLTAYLTQVDSATSKAAP